MRLIAILVIMTLIGCANLPDNKGKLLNVAKIDGQKVFVGNTADEAEVKLGEPDQVVEDVCCEGSLSMTLGKSSIYHNIAQPESCWWYGDITLGIRDGIVIEIIKHKGDK